MSAENEAIADIAAEIGEKSDFCHNNISTKTWEDWERMYEWLLNLRRRVVGFALRRAIELSTRFVPGNAAKLREALMKLDKWLYIGVDGYVHSQPNEAHEIKRTIKSALAAPPRNCDRFGGDIEKLREACLRERGLNPDEDFPEIFCEWLLSTAANENGDSNGNK